MTSAPSTATPPGGTPSPAIVSGAIAPRAERRRQVQALASGRDCELGAPDDQAAADADGSVEALTIKHIPGLLGTRMPQQPLETLSPLRYPGSKRKMVPALRTLLTASATDIDLFVEPFCGGASVALRLLHAGLVNRVILADLDPLVAAFWQTAAFDSKWLIREMQKEDITLDRWDYWRTTYPTARRQRALKCLFLNRTTFSGIMHGRAGPIGGRAQTSDYKIDCRFPKDTLAARIAHVASLADEGKIVAVWNRPWTTSLADVASDETFDAASTLFYLDPPYIHKAQKLYKRSFTEADHRGLAEFLVDRSRQLHWVLSYDEDPVVTGLYFDRPGVQVFRPAHHYTASGSRTELTPGRELVFTNLIPADDPGDVMLVQESGGGADAPRCAVRDQ